MRVQITKNTKKRLDDYNKYEETINGTVNRLLDEVEKDMIGEEFDFGKSIILLDKTTADRVKSLAIRHGESYDSILSRALDKLP